MIRSPRASQAPKAFAVMALKPEDPSGGFQHGKVVDFINEKMARHVKGLEFYIENTSLSWVEVEDKLKAILEDSAMPSKAKEACAWGSLALGVRFARRQGQLNACRVQWLHDFAKLHKSAARALASDLKELTAQQEMERKKAAYRLQLTQAKLEKVQKERDLLRCQLFQVRLPHVIPAPSPCLAFVYGPHPQNRSHPAHFSPGTAVSPGAGADRRGARPGHCQWDWDRKSR